MIHLSKFIDFFTPAHRRPVEEHLLRDNATRRLITETEELLNRMIDKAEGNNKSLTIRRKQKEFFIKIKINQKWIKILMKDTKGSQAAIHKQLNISCFRKYIKSKDGVGVCKEATIHYLKDGRAHVRSIKRVLPFSRHFLSSSSSRRSLYKWICLTLTYSYFSVTATNAIGGYSPHSR